MIVFFDGASVKVRVVPLKVKTVLPNAFVVFVNALSTYKVITSLFAFKFVRVNVAVSPSPLKVSLVTFSKINENGSRCVIDPLSKIKESSVKSGFGRDPDLH